MKKNSFINILLSLTVIAVTFLILESVIEDKFITQTPVKFQFALPAGLAVLAQSSKSERLPENYIAIAGDSYAQGKGDWLLQIDPDSNSEFNSGHILHDLTGKDVITFGKSGASNIKGWVREPIAKYQFIKRNIDSHLQEPDIILAYFYAGNDLLENVVQIREDFIPEYGKDKLNNDKAWKDFFLDYIKQRKTGPFSGIDSNTGWFPRAVVKIIKNELKEKKVGAELGDIHIQVTGKINSVWVNGKEVKIPDALQSPALELTKAETDLGFMAAKRSLKYLHDFFKNSKIIVVYIPAVIESYAKVSDKISTSNIIAKDPTKSVEIHTAEELMQRSDEIAGRVKQMSESLGIPFIDTRPDIREASKKQIIHGPIDWKHFNKAGYTALAESIYAGLEKNNILSGNKSKTSSVQQ